jgi:hypothetical protein
LERLDRQYFVGSLFCGSYGRFAQNDLWINQDIQILPTYGQKEDFNGYRIITTEAVHLPFSFFKGIYVSRHVPLQDHIHTILEHEEIHIRQWHTLDVLMAEMVHAFFWFNPVMIFYKRALRQAHEYLADDLICRKNSVSSYTELLLSKSQSGLRIGAYQSIFSFTNQKTYSNDDNT